MKQRKVPVYKKNGIFETELPPAKNTLAGLGYGEGMKGKKGEKDFFSSLFPTPTWQLHAHPLVAHNGVADARFVKHALFLLALRIAEKVLVDVALFVKGVLVLLLALVVVVVVSSGTGLGCCCCCCREGCFDK